MKFECMTLFLGLLLLSWNYSEIQASVEVSDLALANVEALAFGESGGNQPCLKMLQ